MYLKAKRVERGPRERSVSKRKKIHRHALFYRASLYCVSQVLRFFTNWRETLHQQKDYDSLYCNILCGGGLDPSPQYHQGGPVVSTAPQASDQFLSLMSLIYICALIYLFVLIYLRICIYIEADTKTCFLHPLIQFSVPALSSVWPFIHKIITNNANSYHYVIIKILASLPWVPIVCQAPQLGRRAGALSKISTPRLSLLLQRGPLCLLEFN